MRGDENLVKNKKRSKHRLMIIAAIFILIIGFASGGSIIYSYYSEVNYYNSDAGIKERTEIDKQIAGLKEEQREEWIDNDRSEKYFEIEAEIESLIELKNKKPPIRTVCYGIFPMIAALTFSIPLMVLAVADRRNT